MEEIQEDWLMERLYEDPSLTLESLQYDSSSDEEWMINTQKTIEQEELKKVFNKAKEKDFEEVERESR